MEAKELKGSLEDIGLLGTLGVLFFTLSGVVIVGPEILDMKELAKKPDVYGRIGFGIVAGILSAIFFIAAIVREKPKKYSTDVEDVSVLASEILPPFEREAFRNNNCADEDLRALFSACNETRIALNMTINKLQNAATRKLVRAVINDLTEISAFSPFRRSEIGVAPDPTGKRCEDDRQIVAKWFIGGGDKIIGTLFDDFIDPKRPTAEKAVYIYGNLQRWLWKRLEPVRATYLCLSRIRA